MTLESITLVPPIFHNNPTELDDTFYFSLHLHPCLSKCGEDPREANLDGKETILFIGEDCGWRGHNHGNSKRHHNDDKLWEWY